MYGRVLDDFDDFGLTTLCLFVKSERRRIHSYNRTFGRFSFNQNRGKTSPCQSLVPRFQCLSDLSDTVLLHLGGGSLAGKTQNSWRLPQGWQGAEDH